MAEFVVGDVFEITCRGPCVTRPKEQSAKAVDEDQYFSPGEEVRCGGLTATIGGIEHYLGGTEHTRSMQLSLILSGVGIEDLAVGQVWTNG